MLKKINAFHKTKSGCLLFGLIELGLAYYFVSLAFDRGSLIWYLLTLLFLVGALQNLFRFVAELFKRKTRRRG
jgi:hypothetical protein